MPALPEQLSQSGDLQLDKNNETQHCAKPDAEQTTSPKNPEQHGISGIAEHASRSALPKPKNLGHKSSPLHKLGLMARLSRWLQHPPFAEKIDMGLLFQASLKDDAANQLARKWTSQYLTATVDQKRVLLATLVEAYLRLDSPPETPAFRRLYAQSGSLSFMVDLRADMLRWRNQIAGLGALEHTLAITLNHWFDVGMLEMRPITWDSPASLLEKLIKYEAVHAIESWDDMRRRVAADRRCYAFFHPRMIDIPLIFVEVAFSEDMLGNIHDLIDPQRPVNSLDKARWAIFYSISTTQNGLRGISFGNFLLKRVIEQIKQELPQVKAFATLSPVPGFSRWLEKQSADSLSHLLSRKVSANEAKKTGVQWLKQLQNAARQTAIPPATEKIAHQLLAYYLTSQQKETLIDSVARFHMGNGARIERLNWQADCSAKGIEQSCGMMVNYLYVPAELDSNRAQLAAGNPRLARSIQKLI